MVRMARPLAALVALVGTPAQAAPAHYPMVRRERCGADARGTFRRDAFGLDAGRDYGFDMRVTLQIQVEALKDA